MFSYDSLNAPPLRLRAAEFQLETFKASLRAGFITGLPRFAHNDWVPNLVLVLVLELAPAMATLCVLRLPKAEQPFSFPA